MPRKKNSAPAHAEQAEKKPKANSRSAPPLSRANKPAQPGTADGADQKKPPGVDPSTDRPAPGLDDARHAAAQRAAHQAEIIRKLVFPAMMADAIGYEGTFTDSAYKLFLDQLLEDAGSPTDPIERMLLQQLALAHFRIGQLHVSAGHAEGVTAAKVYNSLAARLLGEFRRTALGLRAYRGQVPEGKPAKPLTLFKAAQ